MIIFRTQASEKVGFGHIKRSVYLASLIKKKNEIVFILKKDKTAVRFIADRGFKYIFIDNLDCINWSSVRGIIFDIRKTDQYDKNILKISKEKKIKTAQITDLGLNRLDVDAIIDGSIVIKEPFIDNVEHNILFGPQYSILHHKFIHFNKIKKRYRKKIKNILISLGSTVQYRQLRSLIDILYKYNYNLKLTGGFYLKKSVKKILTRIYPKIKFVGIVESFARPLFEADIAIVTTGIISYEAAAVGTPALYFFYNKEQEFISDILEKEGIGIKISDIKKIDKENLLKTLKSITLKDRILMGNKGKHLFDGSGVYKIIVFLSEIGVINK